MSYTPPTYVDTKAQAILALASVVADADKTNLGDGSVNKALDVLADVLAESDVQVPQTNAGAILALAQYASGMIKPEGTITITENGEGIDVAQYASADVSVSGGGGDLTTAAISLTLPNSNLLYVSFPTTYDDETEPFSMVANVMQTADMDIVLYKGACLLDVVLDEGADPSQYSFSSTGDIEQVEGAGSYMVTGDCSITVTVV